ncbi:AAA-ATPase [Microbacterium phage Pikmin]|uniref:AAA-ATPase n=3 Tax=Pikminvirus pikmin TaxID=2560596 RepID=A0A2P1CKJ8_9CAUD|nr:AAA-ATPase [Microbacterium phage Pikmin]AVJ51024.1 AAA-ATPase [Microbacterium phage Pajaza]AVJ51171.1 AAA-ATPase [Microbacterium phage Pikmin]AVJ51729.1 AAA-ATPase [Microbacterium phage Casey]
MSIYTIYSKPKVGKTTLSLAEAKKGKTAVLNADQGLVGIDTTGITLVNDLSSKGINKTITPAFLAKHDRVIIDTATSLHDLFLSEAAGGKTPSQQSYGIANNAFATLLRTLRDENKEVIVLCQERMVMPTEDWVSDDDDEETTASVTVDLPPGAAKSLLTMSDVIGRLYIANVNDRAVRRLWLTPTPNIVAGARSKTYKGRPPYLTKPSISRLNELLGWTR